MLIRVLPNLVKLDQGWAKYLAKFSGFQLNSHSQQNPPGLTAADPPGVMTVDPPGTMVSDY